MSHTLDHVQAAAFALYQFQATAEDDLIESRMRLVIWGGIDGSHNLAAVGSLSTLG